MPRPLPLALNERLTVPLSTTASGSSSNPGPSRAIRKDIPPNVVSLGNPPQAVLAQTILPGLKPLMRPRGLP